MLQRTKGTGAKGYAGETAKRKKGERTDRARAGEGKRTRETRAGRKGKERARECRIETCHEAFRRVVQACEPKGEYFDTFRSYYIPSIVKYITDNEVNRIHIKIDLHIFK